MPATRALVIGGSLAGMCAARVLSDVFDNVTISSAIPIPRRPNFDRAFRKLATFTICSLADCGSSRASSPASKHGCVTVARYPWKPAGTSPRCGRMDGLGALTPDYGNSTPAGHLSRVLYSNFVDVYRT